LPVYFDKIFDAEYPLDILAFSSIGKVTMSKKKPQLVSYRSIPL